MSHRYGHLRNVRDLDEEILRLKLKKEIIRAEFSQNLQTAKKKLLTGKYLWSVLLELFGYDKKRRTSHDSLDRASGYVNILSNLLALIKTIRK